MRRLRRRLAPGDTLRVGGGYDGPGSPWLCGMPYLQGRVSAIDGDALLLELDEPQGDTRFLLLRLRYLRARWGRANIVHVERHEEHPASLQVESKERWVESHASYGLISERQRSRGGFSPAIILHDGDEPMPPHPSLE